MSDQYQQQELQEDVNKGQVDDSSTEKPVESSDDYSDGFMAALEPEKEGLQQPEPEPEQVKDVSEPESKDVQQQPEEDETQKDNYKSLLGRHQRLQEEARQLREQQQRLLQQQQQSQPVFEKAEIPEDMKDDVEAFKKQYPEYSALIEVKGREGDRLRRILSEYGVDHAAGHADILVSKIETAMSKQETLRTAKEQADRMAKVIHEQQLFTAHPDFAAFDPSKKREFLEGLENWIKKTPMPFEESAYWNRVYHEGSTHETIQLFNEFKKRHTTSQNNSKQQNTARRQQSIEDGLAVPASARGIRTGSSRPEPDDYTSGFMAACRGR